MTRPISLGHYEMLPCELCGSDVDREHGRLCRMCMGLEDEKMGERKKHGCTCGEDDPSKFYDGSKAECKRCANVRSREYKKRIRERNKPASPIVTQFDPIKALKKRLGDNMFLIDLRGCAWIVDWWKEQGASDMSRVILYELAEHVPADYVKTWNLEKMP